MHSNAPALPTKTIAARGADRQRPGCFRQITATLGVQNRRTSRTRSPRGYLQPVRGFAGICKA
jgi:hypothetical protein